MNMLPQLITGLATLACAAPPGDPSARFALRAHFVQAPVLIGMPVEVTATLRNTSVQGAELSRTVDFLWLYIRPDSEDDYTRYKGVRPYKKVRREPKVLDVGESWEFRDIILYQHHSPNGLQFAKPGRYWVKAVYCVSGLEAAYADPIAIDVMAPTDPIDQWVFDVLTCNDSMNGVEELRESEHIECAKRHFYLLHSGMDPHVNRRPCADYAETFLWLLERGAGESRYGPGIISALERRNEHVRIDAEFLDELTRREPQYANALLIAANDWERIPPERVLPEPRERARTFVERVVRAEFLAPRPNVVADVGYSGGKRGGIEQILFSLRHEDVVLQLGYEPGELVVRVYSAKVPRISTARFDAEAQKLLLARFGLVFRVGPGFENDYEIISKTQCIAGVFIVTGTMQRKQPAKQVPHLDGSEELTSLFDQVDFLVTGSEMQLVVFKISIPNQPGERFEKPTSLFHIPG